MTALREEWRSQNQRLVLRSKSWHRASSPRQRAKNYIASYIAVAATLAATTAVSIVTVIQGMLATGDLEPFDGTKKIATTSSVLVSQTRAALQPQPATQRVKVRERGKRAPTGVCCAGCSEMPFGRLFATPAKCCAISHEEVCVTQAESHQDALGAPRLTHLLLRFSPSKMHVSSIEILPLYCTDPEIITFLKPLQTDSTVSELI